MYIKKYNHSTPWPNSIPKLGGADRGHQPEGSWEASSLTSICNKLKQSTPWAQSSEKNFLARKWWMTAFSFLLPKSLTKVSDW